MCIIIIGPLYIVLQSTVGHIFARRNAYNPQCFPKALSHWKLISKFMLISSFRKKISSVNSQLSKEINFKIVFRNLEHVLFCEISQKKNSLMERCDWSVGQCLQTSNEASTMLAFESLFPV